VGVVVVGGAGVAAGDFGEQFEEVGLAEGGVVGFGGVTEDAVEAAEVFASGDGDAGFPVGDGSAGHAEGFG
jgi:hypothetical protein